MMAKTTPSGRVLIRFSNAAVKHALIKLNERTNKLVTAHNAQQEVLATIVEEVEALRDGKASKADWARLLGDVNHLRNRLDTLVDELDLDDFEEEDGQ